MRGQFAAFRERAVGGKNGFAGHGIEPCRDSHAVKVIHGGARSFEILLFRGRGQKGLDLVQAGVHRKTGGREIAPDAVVAALQVREVAEELLVHSGLREQNAIGPAGVAVHATHEHRQLRVDSGIKPGVEFVGL